MGINWQHRSIIIAGQRGSGKTAWGLSQCLEKLLSDPELILHTNVLITEGLFEAHPTLRDRVKQFVLPVDNGTRENEGPDDWPLEPVLNATQLAKLKIKNAIVLVDEAGEYLNNKTAGEKLCVAIGRLRHYASWLVMCSQDHKAIAARVRETADGCYMVRNSVVEGLTLTGGPFEALALLGIRIPAPPFKRIDRFQRGSDFRKLLHSEPYELDASIYTKYNSVGGTFGNESGGDAHQEATTAKAAALGQWRSALTPIAGVAITAWVLWPSSIVPEKMAQAQADSKKAQVQPVQTIASAGTQDVVSPKVEDTPGGGIEKRVEIEAYRYEEAREDRRPVSFGNGWTLLDVDKKMRRVAIDLNGDWKREVAPLAKLYVPMREDEVEAYLSQE